MALKATIFKAELQVSDLDRGHFETHALTIARHPSETDERMMVRVAAFALHADERLTFGAGVSSTDEPALWRRDLTGAIEEWIEVGLPEPRLLKRAAGRSRDVYLYIYGRGADIWWKQNARDLHAIDRLNVTMFESETTQALAAMAERTMRLQYLVQDGEGTMSSEAASVVLERQRLLPLA